MKVTLPNGLLIEGTDEQIQDTLKKLGFANLLGDSTYYFSKSKGPVLISGMETTHLRNAILKVYDEWVLSLHSITEPAVLIRTMYNGISETDNPTWHAMLREYSKRKI